MFSFDLQTPQNQNNMPSLREKSLLLYRMMLNFEKRFSDELELHAQFSEIVHFVYRYVFIVEYSVVCVHSCVLFI